MAEVFLNGDYLPAEQASISVFDRGFLLGDGVYEVIPVYSGKSFHLAGHLARLQRSLSAVKMANPYTDNEWANLFDELILRNGGGNQALYLQVSRGVAPRDHIFPDDVAPSVFAMSNPIKALAETYYSKGIKAITLADPRWQRCDIKAISLLPNSLLKQEAKESGAEEALLIRDGYMTEGAASNAYAIFDGVIYTAPKGPHILSGITRDVVVELARQNDIQVVEEAVKESRLLEADELWVSSSTKEVLPITTLNDATIGSGEPGPVWQRIHSLYQQAKLEAQS